MPDLTTMLGGACAFGLLGALFAFFVAVMNWYENKQLQRKKEWEKCKRDLFDQIERVERLGQMDREKGSP